MNEENVSLNVKFHSTADIYNEILNEHKLNSKEYYCHSKRI